MSVQFYPLAGCLENALERQAALVNSVLHLFQSPFVPTASSVLADFDDAEADYDTYAAETLAAWFDPILAPGSGYMIGSPLVQFEVGDTDPVTPNVIAGAYLTDQTGKLRWSVTFTETVPMQLAGQGIPLNLIFLFPTGVA